MIIMFKFVSNTKYVFPLCQRRGVLLNDIKQTLVEVENWMDLDQDIIPLLSNIFKIFHNEKKIKIKN